jgi:H+/Cl- antiporter ClcA
MLHDLSHDKPGDSGADSRVTGEQLARQQAIRQIERRRRFWFSTVAWAVVMIVVAVIWAFSEYHNAGGWPTNGFSESSGIPNVWNYWIIYPAIAWVLLTAANAWWVFGRKPISEDQIKHEMERQAGQR